MSQLYIWLMRKENGNMHILYYKNDFVCFCHIYRVKCIKNQKFANFNWFKWIPILVTLINWLSFFFFIDSPFAS